MTTSYLECDHKWHAQFSNMFKAAFWSCDLCEVRTWRAPWSYREVIAAIGLHSLMRSSNEARLRSGEPTFTREQFATQLALFAMTPPQFIQALQAGISWVTPRTDVDLMNALRERRIVQ